MARIVTLPRLAWLAFPLVEPGSRFNSIWTISCNTGREQFPQENKEIEVILAETGLNISHAKQTNSCLIHRGNCVYFFFSIKHIHVSGIQWAVWLNLRCVGCWELGAANDVEPSKTRHLQFQQQVSRLELCPQTSVHIISCRVLNADSGPCFRFIKWIFGPGTKHLNCFKGDNLT